MSKGIQIEVELEAVSVALDRLAAVDLKKAHDAIGAAIVASTRRRFEQEQDPDGQAWGRLKPRTANRRIGKRRRGFGNILRDTNRLYASISHLVHGDTIRIGTNLPYAAIHRTHPA